MTPNTNAGLLANLTNQVSSHAALDDARMAEIYASARSAIASAAAAPAAPEHVELALAALRCASAIVSRDSRLLVPETCHDFLRNSFAGGLADAPDVVVEGVKLLQACLAASRGLLDLSPALSAALLESATMPVRAVLCDVSLVDGSDRRVKPICEVLKQLTTMLPDPKRRDLGAPHGTASAAQELVPTLDDVPRAPRRVHGGRQRAQPAFPS